MRTDTVEEPAVVADDYGTSGKVLKTLLECTQRVHVDIVGRLVEEQYVTLLLQCEGKLQAVALTTRKHRTHLLLITTGKVESA